MNSRASILTPTIICWGVLRNFDEKVESMNDMQTHSFCVVSDSVEKTTQIAAIIAGRLIEGDVVLLKGGLGAGKTAFVKAAAAALGSEDMVTSPTFGLAQFYESEAGCILHADAYRLKDVDEYRDLGLEGYIESCITLVEWGERLSTEFDCFLLIELRQDRVLADSRLVTLSTPCARWSDIFDGLRSELMGGSI